MSPIESSQRGAISMECVDLFFPSVWTFLVRDDDDEFFNAMKIMRASMDGSNSEW